MGKWIKANLVLVSGIVLPILLVGGFFVLSSMPRILADPPTHDFLLVGYRYDYQHPREYSLSFEVKDQKLSGKVVSFDEGNTHRNRQYAAIFRYDTESNTFDEIVFDLPDGLDDMQDPISFVVHETSELILDKRKKSPDNYTFEYLGYPGRGGLLGEIFGMGRRRHDSGYVLKQNGAYFNLPKPASDPYYYQHDLHFMGWVIPAENTP